MRAPLALLATLATFASATAGDLHATWVNPDELHLERVLPPPPAPGSPEERADLAAVEAAVAARTRADEARIDAEKPCTALAFAGDIFGPGFTAAGVPLTIALVEHAFEDTELAVLAAKARIARARPYTLDPHLATYGHRSPSSSYPSGHAACGRVMAIILAAVVPAKAPALFARGEIYGRNRGSPARISRATRGRRDGRLGGRRGAVPRPGFSRRSRPRRGRDAVRLEVKMPPHAVMRSSVSVMRWAL